MTRKTRKQPCDVQGCPSPVEGHGLCQMHYFRVRRTGTTEARDNTPLLDRLESQHGAGGMTEEQIAEAFTGRFVIVGPMSCWAVGDPERRRYPAGRRGGKRVNLHRAVFRLVYGDPSQDLVRHRCDRPACIRPSHLLDGTHSENSKDREDRKRGEREYQRA